MDHTSFPHPNGSPRHTSPENARPNVAVIGGSIGGLYTGLVLSAIGCRVDIYEQSEGHPQDYGGGMEVQNHVEIYLADRGIPVEESPATASWIRQQLDLFGNLVDREAAFVRYTGWDTLYRKLRSTFPAAQYHTGMRLERLERDDIGVHARFADGSDVPCDLLVGADGIFSACRQILLPDVRPHDAGYVAWRGILPESALSERTLIALGEKLTLYQGYNMQMSSCMIPGPAGQTDPGERRISWVWYVSMPEEDALRPVMADAGGIIVPAGTLPQQISAKQRAMASALLPPVFLELFEKTAEPLVQRIIDVAVPSMAFGRIALLGDAAFTLRPHTASGAVKAGDDALALAGTLEANGFNVVAALKQWERERLNHGRRLQLWGKALGSKALSGR